MPANDDNKDQWEERTILERVPSYDTRDAFAFDRARLIHSPCFRRLQGKTQVIGLTDGDYHRTRLTHTMEVAQIGRGLVERLRADYDGKPESVVIPNNDLIEAIAFAHDIGHPPFGHNGEIALNYMMRDHGGFEGNGQSLRQIATLEKRLTNDAVRDGLNLTRRTLLGILKYPRRYSDIRKLRNANDLDRILATQGDAFASLKYSDWQPPKCFLDSEQHIVDWILDRFSEEDQQRFTMLNVLPTATSHGKTAHRSLDCSILELADDIAYATHDCEDGIVLGFLTRDKWTYLLEHPDEYDSLRGLSKDQIQEAWEKWHHSAKPATNPNILFPDFIALENYLFHEEGAYRRKAISHIIGALIHSVTIERNDGFTSPLLQYQAHLPEYAKTLLSFMKGVSLELIIKSHQVQELEYRGRLLVLKLFDAINSDPIHLLKDEDRKLHKAVPDDIIQKRIICDYIAGMTDAYAVKMYERLYVPGSGSMFDRI